MRSRRVLIVEDNIDGARTLAMLIRHAGHDTEYAINGYAAIDIAKRFKPHIIFLDIGLPGLNGYEVCTLLKKEPGLEATRIVAVTAYEGQEYSQRSIAAGCHMHLVKPVTTDKLLKLIDEV
jgi:CheY-like chemotaxis protein